MSQSTEILDRLRQLYESQGVRYREVAHEPTYTSEDSARARGEPLRIGGKALLLKCQPRNEPAGAASSLSEAIARAGGFLLVVLPADTQLNSPLARDNLKLKKIRFATADELFHTTGLRPGSVPPFGPPILPFPVVVDKNLLENKRIAFNAGSLTTSHVLAMNDYLKLVHAVEAELCKR